MNPDGTRGFFGALAIALVAIAMVGHVFTPHDPMSQAFLDQRFSGSSLNHWLGIDGLGRDFASRLWAGAANTVSMAVIAVTVSVLLSAGLLFCEQNEPFIAGRIIRSLVSVWIAIPVLFVGLILLVFLRPSPATLILAAALGTVPLAFRQLRILWIEQSQSLYVEASRVLGGSPRHIARVAIWPNMKSDFWALVRLIFALAILELSGLAFLGLIGDPDFPELGAILRQNQTYLFQRPALVFWPGLFLSTLLITIQLSNLRNR